MKVCHCKKMGRTQMVIGLILVIFSLNVRVCQDVEDIQVVEGDGGNIKIMEEGDVLVLNSDNFDLIAGSRDLLLVEFYAPWCGHCKKLDPEYSKAATELKKNFPPIEIAKIDTTQAEDISRRYDVKGFPTILLLNKGEVVESYEGDRSSMAIVQFMKKRADPDYKPPPKRVMELTAKTFKDTIAESKLILVEFYSKDCGICKDIAPKFESAAQELHDVHPSIPLARIDGNVYKDIADEYKAEEWPVFKIFRFGRVFDYEGPREPADMVTYMRNQLKMPSLEVKNKQQLNNNLSNDSISIVGFFSSKDTPFYAEYLAAAYVLKDTFKFSHTFSEEVVKMFGESMDSMVIFKPSIYHSKFEDPRYRIIEPQVTDEDIKEFIKMHKIPLVGQRTKNNMHLYDDRPLCVIYGDINFNHDYLAASQIIRKQILKVADEFKDIKFALSNEDEFQDDLVNLGLDDSGEEINAALYYARTKRYALKPEDEFDSDVLRKFLKDATSGKLKPILKSQAIPKKNSSPVKKIVAQTFDDLVMKSPESVFIEFYAPWCGHCKALDPIFKQLAKKYENNPHITIAQMDATVNDVEDTIFTVTGFPTIYFLKGGDKSNPVLFDGSRTLNGMSSYIDSKLNSQEDKKDEL